VRRDKETGMRGMGKKYKGKEEEDKVTKGAKKCRGGRD
jgi:hypothetical protein